MGKNNLTASILTTKEPTKLMSHFLLWPTIVKIALNCDSIYTYKYLKQKFHEIFILTTYSTL